MESGDYLEDGVSRVLKLMKDTFGDYFRGYFNGEPANIPEMYLPCLIVSENRGTIQIESTATDEIIETISIIIVLNKKDYIAPDQDIDLSERTIRRLVKGQDNSGTDGVRPYMPKSVMYALRTNISLYGVDLSNDVEFEFGSDFSVDGDGKGLATEEAIVRLSIKRLALLQGGRS